MASCSGRLEEISAFLDGELCADEELELRRHLDACDVCAAWRMQLEALSKSVAGSLRQERAPRTLANRVARLRPPARRRRAGAAAAAAAALVGAALLVDRNGAGDGAAARLVGDHRRLVAPETALAVLSSDPDAVARGLSARLPFPVAVAEVEGARLRGGQDCSLAEGRAAYLQYEREGERVSVFVVPSLLPASGAEPCRSLAGVTLCTFAGPRETVAVVASRPETAHAFRSAAWVVGSP
jgi:anti-sigma factor RsiW